MTDTQGSSQRSILNINRIPWGVLLITATMLLSATAQVKPAQQEQQRTKESTAEEKSLLEQAQQKVNERNALFKQADQQETERAARFKQAAEKEQARKALLQ